MNAQLLLTSTREVQHQNHQKRTKWEWVGCLTSTVSSSAGQSTSVTVSESQELLSSASADKYLCSPLRRSSISSDGSASEQGACHCMEASSDVLNADYFGNIGAVIRGQLHKDCEFCLPLESVEPRDRDISCVHTCPSRSRARAST